ncbi:hypothetical protein [Salinisphaera sp. G21_0]|uniref:hypothetical protein n=1 Tax=Salinisphaera sp. G21_0 TaxID=2821094 RepID=UPI001ADD2D93|nr:hypothetical protein [Salinisphaera sp. G21_0]MBO9484171.1 hypothetical protein [Salinisphaera sp. G21_0]
MNLTINGKYHPRGNRYQVDKPYEGFGNVIKLEIYTGGYGRRAYFAKTQRVVQAVSCQHPILVDSCMPSSCLVEMDLSSRYIVVADEWRGPDFHLIVRKLQEKRIYALTPVQREDFHAVKSMLEKSYYTDNGKLRDSTFKGHLSPANMAEAGIGLHRKEVVNCHYGFVGFLRHDYKHHYMSIDPDWHDCWSTPKIRHQELYNCPPCIERKKYQYPVLTTESGEDVTGATFQMVIGGGFVPHLDPGCTQAVLVTDKNHELPVMDSQAAQREVFLIIIDTLKKGIRHRVEKNDIGILDFAQQVQQVIFLEHFNALLVKLQLETDRFITLLNQFQLQVENKDDKDEIRKKIKVITEALKADVIKKEISEFIDVITNYEKANAFSTIMKRLKDRKRMAGAEDMPELDRVEQELVKLSKSYSGQFFLDNFFDSSVKTADFDDFFADFQHYFWNRSDDSQLIADIMISRSELLATINPVHDKVEELLTTYLEACNGQDPSDNPAQTLQSPLLGEFVPCRLTSASLANDKTSYLWKTGNTFRIPNCCVTGWLTDTDHVLHCHLPS